MNPKKLIRSGIVDKLLPREVDTITDKAELNKLYALKVKEELQEIIDSDCADINEFGDLLSVVKSFAYANGFDLNELFRLSLDKDHIKGIYSNLALNNLNPENPSNKLYFEKKPRFLLGVIGPHMFSSDQELISKVMYESGKNCAIHVYPDEMNRVKNALYQLSEESAKKIILKAPISFDDMMNVKLPDHYTISERSHMPTQPVPSARRNRRKKNRRKL